MANKNITLNIGTNADLTGVEAIEKRLAKIKSEKIQLRVDAKTEELEQANQRIEYLKRTIAGLEAVPAHLGIDVDESEIEAMKTELASLQQKTANLRLDVEKEELEQAKAEIEEMDGEEIEVQLRNQSAMEALDQISQGFDRVRQGASELGQQMGTLLESAGKQETNFSFLSHALNNDEALAKQKMSKIQEIVSTLPGDDTAVQGLLSQAIAKDASLADTTLSDIGTAYADYASAMQYYGKSGIEAQQDMTNYILAGNTAELERSPILASHIDKLKEANTVQERANALQQALNEEHWGGMSKQDTYNNKLQTFMGMLDRGKYTLGGFFQEGAKGAMDFLLNLDKATGGVVGMGLAVGQMAMPMADVFMGLGQMATGMKAIKDLGFIQFLKDLEIAQKLSAAATWLQNTALWGMIAPILANPITWIVIALIALAAALIWAYQNVDWFREMVDNAWASLVQFGQQIYGAITGAIQWLGSLFQNFTSQLGLNTNDWIQSVLGFILFIPTLPLQVGIALINTIAKALGFGNNFTQTMVNGAVNAVNGFISWITTLPSRLADELNKMLQMASDFAIKIADTLTGGAAGMVIGWITGSGEHSPGYMYDAFTGELKAMEDAPSQYDFSMKDIGQDMVNGFNPNLQTGNGDMFNQTGGNNITINIDNVDSEDRVRQIAQVVEDILKFDNLKAGRTV